MAGPVGHFLVGFAVSTPQIRSNPRFSWGILAVVLISSIMPDFDFLPGLLLGDINRYHHGASHSIGAALIFALFTAQLCHRIFRGYVQAFLVCVSVYSSHLVADMLTVDTAAPLGIPLFWPLSGEYYISPIAIFINVQHGIPGQENLAVLSSIFSVHNLMAMLLEIGICGLLLWFARPLRLPGSRQQ